MSENYRNIRLLDTELSRHSKNALIAAGYYLMGEIEQVPERTLLRIANFGRKGMNELAEWFDAHGGLVGQKRDDLVHSVKAMYNRLETLERETKITQRNIEHAEKRLGTWNG
jgi:DNA-directed RNA polymerase alpha subunit